MANSYREPAYQRWMREEGIPIVRGHGVTNVMALELGPWERLGGRGAFIDLMGMEGLTGLYVAEIPPGGRLAPERHMYEELIYVLSGRGSTKVWAGPRQPQDGQVTVFEWQAGTLFTPPLNTWHELFNLSGSQPVRFLGATIAPLIMDIFHNSRFVFDCPFEFDDRFSPRPDYFDVGERSFFETTGSWLWETNLIPDVKWTSLKTDNRKGTGWGTVYQMDGNILAGHMYEWPIGRYQKAHFHSGGAIVLTVRGGPGYSLLWPRDAGIQPYESGNGDKVVRVNWQEGSIVAPPGDWFHQHFNTSPEPVRQLAIRLGSMRYGVQFHDIQTREGVLLSVKEGGTMIEYEDEDPEIQRMFQQALDTAGVENKMAIRAVL